MIKKIVFIFVILSISTVALASSRSENEKILYEKMGIEAIVQKSISSYKKEVLRLYPALTKKILDEDFGDIFSEAATNYRNSYINAFDVYSDKELQELVDFYNTNFGTWLVTKGVEYNRQVQLNFESPYKELNSAFTKRYYSKYQNP